MLNTFFTGGSCLESQGSAAYMLLDDRSRLWMPYSLRFWLVNFKIVILIYESFGPVDKLLVEVTGSDSGRRTAPQLPSNFRRFAGI